ncbi:HPr family phosphocarrier protein [Buchnera aphidicola (Kurisakia onigurumii)]|uniref:HPr family phosphocarrier protein n=1 Tax=Buchnera aphidicola TaxID=9 RepID=UPI0031B6CF16
MISKKIVITAENGLHIRPAAVFVKEAKKFKSDITITLEKNTVNAKSLFKLQTLGLTKGTTVILSIHGNDEKKAMESISKIIKNIF